MLDHTDNSTLGYAKMRAVVQDGYDNVGRLRIALLDVPSPSPHQVLIKMRAVGVHADVWHVVAGYPRVLRLLGSGIRRPKQMIPGTDVAGEVVALGSDVTSLKVGDRVFGETQLGIQWKNGGSYAEYVSADARALIKMPDGLGFEEAATLPTSGHIALVNLKGAGELDSASHVLVNGAAGAVGSIAVAYAQRLGAQVSAVDSAERLPALLERGVAHVFDYENHGFPPEKEQFDLIFDVASTIPLKLALERLKPKGKYVRIGHDHYGKKGQANLGELPALLSLAFRSLFEPKLRVSMANIKKAQSMQILCDLLADGTLRPEVGHRFALEQVNEAMRLLASGRAQGRIVLVSDDAQ